MKKFLMRIYDLDFEDNREAFKDIKKAQKELLDFYSNNLSNSLAEISDVEIGSTIAEVIQIARNIDDKIWLSDNDKHIYVSDNYITNIMRECDRKHTDVLFKAFSKFENNSLELIKLVANYLKKLNYFFAYFGEYKMGVKIEAIANQKALQFSLTSLINRINNYNGEFEHFKDENKGTQISLFSNVSELMTVLSSLNDKINDLRQSLYYKFSKNNSLNVDTIIIEENLIEEIKKLIWKRRAKRATPTECGKINGLSHFQFETEQLSDLFLLIFENKALITD